ncbi:S-adenosyl methyltransferase [Actinopolyspora mzabensis]|uniref:S-adenosyl methyltransferase n=1 Tax=Actinopolyspora mzabensis TaxID=995066 RepID=A0A1G9EMF6_ACTMZ|nr:SAM-dependent methyltransferase [Actinopolyspora mzabensis]SDK77304.1 S-adenosyl methyltransferase [Actinopolyspora mzabensis]
MAIETNVPAPSSVPVGVDPTRASIARVYDAALGGKDNYAVDQQVLDEIKTAAPEIRDMAWANRNFLIRVARFLTNETDVRQFIDCGSGLPTAENTHQVVQRLDDQVRVCYVDNDPVVLAHGNALLADNEGTHIVDADIYKPEQVYNHDVVARNIDFEQPVGLLHISTIHHYPDDDYAELMRRYIEPLPSGSFVAVSHFLDPQTPELSPLARRLEDIMTQSAMGSGAFRTHEQIAAMVPGMEIIQPGPGLDPDVVLCDQWWPDGPKLRPYKDVERCLGCVVARKP